MKNLLHSFMAMAVIISLGTTAVSCNNNDNSDTKLPASRMVGNYTGTFTHTPQNMTASAPQPISLKVTDDAIVFTDFPITLLVASIVGAENAPAIVEAIGKINYSVPYKAVANSSNTSLVVTMTPGDMVINIPDMNGIASRVNVTMSCENPAMYIDKTKMFNFILSAVDVTVDGENFPQFPNTIFTFAVTKQ